MMSCKLGMVASLPYTLTTDEAAEFMYRSRGWELTHMVVHPDGEPLIAWEEIDIPAPSDE
jgi:hypothetical protein